MRLTYSPNAYLWAGLACLALSGSACGSNDTGGQSSDEDGGNVVDTGDASSLVCEGTSTAACTCSNKQSGRKTCKNSRWGGCVCGIPPSDAGIPRSTQDLCKAGYYTGGFTGTYFPGFAGGGVFPSGFSVMIEGKSLNDTPPLAFTLNENETGPAGEFHSFTVGNGCMTGNANAFGVVDNPFVARITGTLDCGTGYFTGQLDGQYQLLGIFPVPSLFSGPLTAQFYLPQNLKDGAWMVSEPASLSGPAMGGGMGSWNADWSADDAPVTATDPCAAVSMLIDGGVWTDPNGDTTVTPPVTTPPKTDAGVRDAGT
ncbi:MAG: hypothetical protein JWN04_593 [Myxococcaceae bacterium]|nr:hypothetical protein [Myxococcaceae bacterium]